VVTAKEIFDLKYEKILLRVMRQTRYLDLGNVSKSLGTTAVQDKLNLNLLYRHALVDFHFNSPWA